MFACRTAIILLVAFILSLASAAAQVDDVLTFNENRLGEINSPGATVSYAIAAMPGETVALQVLGFNEGLVPAFSVFDNANNLIRVVENSSGNSVVQGNVTFTQSGTYIVQIRGANNTIGRFVVSMQPAVAQPDATPLNIGQMVLNVVSLTAPIQRYSFGAQPGNALTLQVRSIVESGGPAVTLIDALSGETLATMSPRLTGGDWQIPSGAGSFIVEVQHSGASFDEGFSINLLTGTIAENVAASAVSVAPTVPPPPPAPSPTPIPEDVDLVLRWNLDNIVVTNVSGGTPDLTGLRFVGGGLEVDATVIIQSGAPTALTAFPNGSCFAFRPLGFTEPPPSPPECQTMRAWWFSNNVVFWTGASFDVIYNGQTVTTCPAGSGRCEVDLPGV
ncbi:MAG: hypothetical protein D6737_13005 [Chloroflexi bacterium]|nr:MAG: hypothetical protein D6737_13005 [Chloroflexota bacterium]